MLPRNGEGSCSKVTRARHRSQRLARRPQRILNDLRGSHRGHNLSLMCRNGSPIAQKESRTGHKGLQEVISGAENSACPYELPAVVAGYQRRAMSSSRMPQATKFHNSGIRALVFQGNQTQRTQKEHIARLRCRDVRLRWRWPERWLEDAVQAPEGGGGQQRPARASAVPQAVHRQAVSGQGPPNRSPRARTEAELPSESALPWLFTPGACRVASPARSKARAQRRRAQQGGSAGRFFEAAAAAAGHVRGHSREGSALESAGVSSSGGGGGSGGGSSDSGSSSERGASGRSSSSGDDLEAAGSPTGADATVAQGDPAHHPGGGCSRVFAYGGGSSDGSGSIMALGSSDSSDDEAPGSCSEADVSSGCSSDDGTASDDGGGGGGYVSGSAAEGLPGSSGGRTDPSRGGEAAHAHLGPRLPLAHLQRWALPPPLFPRIALQAAMDQRTVARRALPASSATAASRQTTASARRAT